MIDHYAQVMNGDVLVLERYYLCDRCSHVWNEMGGVVLNGTGHLCADCGLITGKLDGTEYLALIGGFDMSMFDAAVRPDGSISIFTRNSSGLPPWLRPGKTQRQSDSYSEWRTSVFERDDYRCTVCGERGGELNAHHIKSFKWFPQLRLSIDNGKTLCLKCHREWHRNNGRREKSAK